MWVFTVLHDDHVERSSFQIIVESNNAFAIPKIGDGLLQNPVPVFEPMRRHKTETHCAVGSCCD